MRKKNGLKLGSIHSCMMYSTQWRGCKTASSWERLGLGCGAGKQRFGWDSVRVCDYDLLRYEDRVRPGMAAQPQRFTKLRWRLWACVILCARSMMIYQIHNLFENHILASNSLEYTHFPNKLLISCWTSLHWLASKRFRISSTSSSFTTPSGLASEMTKIICMIMIRSTMYAMKHQSTPGLELSKCLQM